MLKTKEQEMKLEAKEKTSRFWVGMFAVFGTINLFDYFYKFSFDLDNLLQGGWISACSSLGLPQA